MRRKSDNSGEHERPRCTVAWQSLIAVVIAVLGTPFFMCICGHIDRLGLSVTIPAGILAWWGFTRRQSPVGRVFAMLVVVVATMVLIRNVLDVGWFGHNPIFP